MERVLCLGSGAVTGAGWQLGVVAGLAREGVDLTAADRIIGTSAGALVGAHLALGRSPEEATERLLGLSVDGRALRPGTLARLGIAQVWPSRRHAVVWLGRRATGADRSGDRGRAWTASLADGLAGQAWPAGLVVVATDATTGRPAYFTAGSGVDLAEAVAASCAMPGVFPPVVVEGRAHFDGGLRSPVNLDLADGADVVVAVAPWGSSARAHRRPRHQARQLAGTTVVLLQPDARSRRVMGLDPLATGGGQRALALGKEFGYRRAEWVRKAWQQPG